MFRRRTVVPGRKVVRQPIAPLMGEYGVPGLAKPTPKVASVAHPLITNKWPVLFTKVRVAGIFVPAFKVDLLIAKVTVQLLVRAVTELADAADDVVPSTAARRSKAAPAAPSNLESLIVLSFIFRRPARVDARVVCSEPVPAVPIITPEIRSNGSPPTSRIHTGL